MSYSSLLWSEAEAAGDVQEAGAAELRLPAPPHPREPREGGAHHAQHGPEDLRHTEETAQSHLRHCRRTGSDKY